MEANLLDSSKYKIKLVSLDSRFASSRGENNGEFRITLPNTMRNVMRVRMASSEIPFVEYEFSTAHGNTTFAVRVGTATTFTKCTPIPEGNYTAQKLMDAIQLSLQAVDAGFTCTFDSVTGLVTIQNSSQPFSLYLASFQKGIAQRSYNWGIGFNLGFPKIILSSTPGTAGVNTLVADTVLNLQTTQYYLLQLECPEPVENVVHPAKEHGYLNAFAKVVLKDNVYTFNFDDNSNLMRKEFTYLAPHSIPFFHCRLINAWGDVIDMQDHDWSITIEVTEVMNSRTYAEISKTYAR